MQSGQPPSPPVQSSAGAASKVAILMVAVLAFFIIGLIYLFIFMFSGLSETDMYLWSGITGWIFAFVFYIVHATTREDPITRIISIVFFVLGAVFLFASIAFNPGHDPGSMILWLIVLSIIVIVILLFSWRLSLQASEDEQRRARRQRT